MMDETIEQLCNRLEGMLLDVPSGAWTAASDASDNLYQAHLVICRNARAERWEVLLDAPTRGIADFISASHDAVPRLIAELRRLRNALAPGGDRLRFLADCARQTYEAGLDRDECSSDEIWRVVVRETLVEASRLSCC